MNKDAIIVLLGVALVFAAAMAWTASATPAACSHQQAERAILNDFVLVVDPNGVAMRAYPDPVRGVRFEPAESGDQNVLWTCDRASN